MSDIDLEGGSEQAETNGVSVTDAVSTEDSEGVDIAACLAGGSSTNRLLDGISTQGVGEDEQRQAGAGDSHTDTGIHRPEQAAWSQNWLFRRALPRSTIGVGELYHSWHVFERQIWEIRSQGFSVEQHEQSCTSGRGVACIEGFCIRLFHCHDVWQARAWWGDSQSSSRRNNLVDLYANMMYPPQGIFPFIVDGSYISVSRSFLWFLGKKTLSLQHYATASLISQSRSWKHSSSVLYSSDGIKDLDSLITIMQAHSRMVTVCLTRMTVSRTSGRWEYIHCGTIVQ